MQLPSEIWQTIGTYIEPNPITYVKLSHVCKTSRTVFTSDQLWRVFTPLEVTKDYARSFFERIATLPLDQKSQLASLWRDVEIFDYWNSSKDYSNIKIEDNFDLALPYSLLVGAKLFKPRDDFGDFDAFSDFEDEDDEFEDEESSDDEGGFSGASPSKAQLPIELFKDKSFVTCAVTLWGPLLANAPEFHGDRKVVLAAVSTKHSLGWTAPETDGHALRFAPEFQKDKDIISEAIISDGLSFEFASPDLQKDPEFVKHIACMNGTVLSFATSDIRANQSIVLEAIKSSGLGLAYASHEIKGDREVVMAAVTIRGASLRDAVPRLKIDKEVIDAAIANDPTAEKYIPEDIDEIKEVLGVAYLPPKEPRPLI